MALAASGVVYVAAKFGKLDTKVIPKEVLLLPREQAVTLPYKMEEPKMHNRNIHYMLSQHFLLKSIDQKNERRCLDTQM